MEDSAPRSSEGHRSFDTGTCYGLKDEPTFTKKGVLQLPENGYFFLLKQLDLVT